MSTAGRFVRLVGLFLVVGLWLGQHSSAQQPSSGHVFEGARVIVGDGSAAIEDAVLVVENGRLTAVGRRGQVNPPAGATRVNLSGKTVMPAIIDTHKHLATTRDALIDQLQRFAYYGVGAAMSLGQDATDDVFQVRAENIPGAARYRTAGRGITTPEPGRSQVPYWITSEAEGRKAVQEQAAKKVNIIKVWVDDRDGQYKKLPPEHYRAVIDEAHKQGLRVTAHIYALSDSKELLRAGIDAFAHSVRDKVVDDEFIQMFKKQPKVVLVPNMADRGVPQDMSWLKDSMPAAEWEKIQAEASKENPESAKIYAIHAANLAKLNAAGVIIALGTDGGVPWAAHVEMADMVKGGMTPSQVITASTRNAADLLGIADMGTLAAGKSADFIVLDANPLDDVTNTRKINAVWLRGAEVDRAALRAKWLNK
jgi:imidazolonepropionase-like amidohydrolase